MRLGIQQTPYHRLRGRRLPLPVPGHDVHRARRRVARRPTRASPFHTNFPNNYGDFHVGLLQRRGLQPRRNQRSEGVHVPRHGAADADGKLEARGLRVTGFWDIDDARRQGRTPQIAPSFQTTATSTSTSTSASTTSKQNDQTLATPATLVDVDAEGLVVLGDAVLQGEGQRPRGADPLRRLQGRTRTIDAMQQARRSSGSPTGSRILAATRPRRCWSTTTA